ncbi:MAG: metallophosphoesterase [Acidobacteria bacterium]|nr:MAG: metallophosphoesterase [Acidobacteriota bacterium]
MRLLLLSDIHGNLEALEACLNAAPEHDGVANLGDVVGYGASPNQVIEIVRSMNPISVRGNHDRCCCGLEDTTDFNPVAAEAVEWTRRELTAINLDWLRALPSGPLCDKRWKDVQFVHGSPLDEDEYITSEFSADAALESSPFHLTFFGHTHVQGAFARRGLRTAALEGDPLRSTTGAHISHLRLDPTLKYLVNPGSIGQPRDYDRRAAFALYDSTKHEVRFYRVPYDIARAQERILQAGLPKILAFRLEEGR